MKEEKELKRWILLLSVLVIFSLIQLSDLLSGMLSTLASVPWWIYFVLAGIVYSGYKVATLTIEDRKVDQNFIEEEGKVFIERMEDEKKRRHKTKAAGE
ncbi:sporulation YhaL family protein [Pseudalkalibacillus caeni]|uniref:sporulation YhaL family protein n=1 Tax=Exobacillus caeni TaxID=2574798 RepID=UPI001FE5FF4A|nr:sporulation YhaL family protein [Pseudalkalibacillus caeni]